MPELPEIETIKLQLEKAIKWNEIDHIDVLNKNTVKGNYKFIEGKKIIGVRRIAKVLIVDLDGGLSMAFHLKMTGQLVYVPKLPELGGQRIVGGHPTIDFFGHLPSSHTRVIFRLTSGSSKKVGVLYFNDQRKFGWIKIVDSEQLSVDSFFKKLGPEPFDINQDKFIKIFSKIKRPIKLALMDQTIISGVGNIYANDALWVAGIKPDLTIDQLTIYQLILIFKSIKKVLREGIKYGGASSSDYVDSTGNNGSYQDHFRVYKREGLPCLKCKTLIKKIKLGGRGTYFCPMCQQ